MFVVHSFFTLPIHQHDDNKPRSMRSLPQPRSEQQSSPGFSLLRYDCESEIQIDDSGQAERHPGAGRRVHGALSGWSSTRQRGDACILCQTGFSQQSWCSEGGARTLLPVLLERGLLGDLQNPRDHHPSSIREDTIPIESFAQKSMEVIHPSVLST